MLFSRKDLLKIVIPLIIQQVLAVLIGMIDSVMVSSVSEAAVSGVSLVGSLDMVLILLFSSLVAGGSVVVSQALGKGKRELVLNSSKQLIYVATAMALFVSVTVLIFRVPLLNLLFGDADADVMGHARKYFFFMALSFPFLAVENAGAALLRSMGKTGASMGISVFMNLLNVAGNALMIYVFHLEAMGAAVATLFARIVGAVISMILLHNKKNPVYVEKLFHYRPDFGVIKRILRIGVPSGVESCMFQFGKLMTQSLISSMGTTAIAGNAVAMSLVNFQYMPGTAIGLAIVTVVGRCIGAGELGQAKKYSRILLFSTYACLWFVNLTMVLLADPIIGIYHTSAETAGLIRFLLLTHSAVGSLIWPVAFTTPHIFRSASDVRFSMIVSVSSMWVFRVALGYVLSLESVSLFGLEIPGLGFGVSGVWMAMYVDWVFRAVLFGIRYFTGRWIQRYKAAA